MHALCMATTHRAALCGVMRLAEAHTAEVAGRRFGSGRGSVAGKWGEVPMGVWKERGGVMAEKAKRAIEITVEDVEQRVGG